MSFPIALSLIAKSSPLYALPNSTPLRERKKAAVVAFFLLVPFTFIRPVTCELVASNGVVAIR